jgi:hypothetical protein
VAAPCRAAADSRSRAELADVFRLYGERYRQSRRLPVFQLKVIRAIQICRTAALGGHMQQCDSCGAEHPLYNSCRNRHCPKCGFSATGRWLEQSQRELLPVGYFHLVFTVPHELNPLLLTNPKVLIGILFKAVAETLTDFGRTHLHGRLGFLGVLHTWDQTLGSHYHIHCVVPAGALAANGRWIAARANFLFSVPALRSVFRAKFLDFLGAAYAANRLVFPSTAAALASEQRFDALPAVVRKKKAVVYAKRPFASPECVLAYLGRYTHRTAISNSRILDVSEGEVSFTYRDRKDASVSKTMTLDAAEFIRRFLLHVLPPGVMRIRHFGFLANRAKRELLPLCRAALVAPVPAPTEPSPELKVWVANARRCPTCQAGTLVAVRTIAPVPWDSS